MPSPQYDWNPQAENGLIAEQLNYDRNQEQQHAMERFSQLNMEQAAACNCILESVEQNLGKDVETIVFLGNSLIAPRTASRTPAKDCSTTKKWKYTFDNTDKENNNTSMPLKRKLLVASDVSLTPITSVG
ncbi:hypothetical protein DEU56DRAFT_917050 [Suillus clintonianus]|uniref:uncharacterized protein n=1 Tax=Suillus clintonianus TaxID=1904413 RepID=UPI001B87D350|nr:uncharacterized protein DEU56DRAFT_917050 [Suillus clintonianus]KAG2124362.1 hypothetical protein DEU56DRAFT_917050 [Suillus clintonianus]